MNSWKPIIIGENLQACLEPKNIMDNNAAALLKDTQIMGHLTKGKSGLYAKTIYYFLPANQSLRSLPVVAVKGKRAKYGDGYGLQISSSIKFKGEAKCIKILQQQLNLFS